MKLIHFLNELPEEESCKLSIKSYREKSGIYCRKCEIQLKREKGSQRQTLVGIAAESIPLENPESGKGSRVCGYFKMEVLAKADSENINQFIKRNTDGDVALFTDKNTAYVNLIKIVNTHFTVTLGKEETNDTLRWVHKAISNLKWNLLGIYKMVT